MAIHTARVLVSGTWHTLTRVGSTNEWKVSINAPGTTSFNLSGGYYPVTVEATNTAQTTASVTATSPTLGSSLRLVVKETVKPVVSVTSPSEGAYLGTASPGVAFTLRDEPGGSGISLTGLSVKIDGVTVGGVVSEPVTNGYDCTFTASNLSDGAHTLTVTVKDNDGNTAALVTRNFTVDTTPPVLTVTSPVQDLITNTAALTVTGTTNDATSPGVTVKITLRGIDKVLLVLAVTVRLVRA